MESTEREDLQKERMKEKSEEVKRRLQHMASAA